MAASELSLEHIYNYFKEHGNVVKNRDLVSYFKEYLTDPASKDDARIKFKKYVNILAQTKTEGDQKFLVLKTRYHRSLDVQRSPQLLNEDPGNSLGIPLSFVYPPKDCSSLSPAHRQPPPYRPPPPAPSPSISSDSISLSSIMSDEGTPQAPPRRKTNDKHKSAEEDSTPIKRVNYENCEEKQTISVKERTEKFNRMASVDDELSPRQPKSAEKSKKGAEEDDGASVTSLEPKKCMEWYVTASKGDIQELLKLAQDEPRLVNRKDPFTAYSVLHWGAKHGNPKIIQIFAGKYKVDVNGKTNGGYTPLHLAAQFGHKNVYNMLIIDYKADAKIRDYSGRLPAFYLEAREQKGNKDNIRKMKSRKKTADKDLGFLRIGSLNVRVKKTTEAFSNFLGVGSGSVTALENMSEKVHKGWGSADNLNQEIGGAGNKGNLAKKKSKRPYSSGISHSPGTPKQMTTNRNSNFYMNDSDSDSAAGFDSQWKN